MQRTNMGWLVIILLLCGLLAPVVVAAEEMAGMKAYRNLFFGMTRDEVEQAVRDDDVFTIEPYLGGVFLPKWYNPERPHELEEYYEELRANTSIYDAAVYVSIAGVKAEVAFHFFKDQLYRIDFTGEYLDYDLFDTTVLDRTELFAQVIEAVYGEPFYRQDLKTYLLRDGWLAYSRQWEVEDGKKHIGVGVWEKKNTFAPGMVIQYMPLLEAKEQAEKAAKQDRIMESVGDF